MQSLLQVSRLLKERLGPARPTREGETMLARTIGAVAARAAGENMMRPAVGTQQRNRPAQREDRRRLQLAGSRGLRRQRRQCHDPLRVRLQLQRLARAAVVHVRHPRDVRRLLHVQAQRACPRRNPLSDADRARPALARHDRHAVLPDPVLPAARLSVLAVLHAGLRGQRDLQQCRRPAPLADQVRGSGRLRPAGAARRLRGHQAHRRAEGLRHDRREIREADCNDHRWR